MVSRALIVVVATMFGCDTSSTPPDAGDGSIADGMIDGTEDAVVMQIAEVEPSEWLPGGAATSMEPKASTYF